MTQLYTTIANKVTKKLAHKSGLSLSPNFSKCLNDYPIVYDQIVHMNYTMYIYIYIYIYIYLYVYTDIYI